MASKTWNFLLPASGQHQVHVQNIGSPEQTIFIDGELQPPTYALVFSGPGDSMLELQNPDCKGWILLVNGMRVEDYHTERSSADETLHELRSRPDGSYMISPTFQVDEGELHIVSKFPFRAGHQPHEVCVAHSSNIWQVIFNGQIIVRDSLRNSFGSHFNLNVAPGLQLPASLVMSSAPRVPGTFMSLRRDLVWSYGLTVNGIEIPISWNREMGTDPSPTDPEVLAISPMVITDAELIASLTRDAVSTELPQIPSPTGEAPAPSVAYQLNEPTLAYGSLPQGVSYDETSRLYQANIRNATGKFVFLGAFSTPEEAHQTYLNAMPIHSPEKRLVAEIPA